MEQIVYISTARALPDGEMLASILSASRRNNLRDGLSGLLVVGGRRFLQLLEGPAEACERAYARIREDDRHFALVELGRKSITRCTFASWEMGFEQASDDNLEAMVDRLVAHVDDPSIAAQFRSFAQLHSTAA
ncbi:hypothetical protein GCM10022280_13970 [Sphingomonas swuensis]|uniref:BLUF domain-containing protein n=1 Tax=Sphingomonas swuensis TaxID=977800 RepID=A0ABP7STR0_9SPHN